MVLVQGFVGLTLGLYVSVAGLAPVFIMTAVAILYLMALGLAPTAALSLFVAGLVTLQIAYLAGVGLRALAWDIAHRLNQAGHRRPADGV